MVAAADQVYYFNGATQESAWEPPAEYLPFDAALDEINEASERAATRSQQDHGALQKRLLTRARLLLLRARAADELAQRRRVAARRQRRAVPVPDHGDALARRARAAALISMRRGLVLVALATRAARSKWPGSQGDQDYVLRDF